MKKFIISLVILIQLTLPCNVFAGWNEKNHTIDDWNIIMKTQDVLQWVDNHYYWQESYKVNVWDCSNMSGLLCYYLESAGVDCIIYCIENKQLHKGHAFLGVKTSEGIYYVEATRLFIYNENELTKVFPGFRITAVFENTQQAHNCWAKEFPYSYEKGF